MDSGVVPFPEGRPFKYISFKWSLIGRFGNFVEEAGTGASSLIWLTHHVMCALTPLQEASFVGRTILIVWVKKKLD